MAKRKNATTETVQHTSTSEAVKTRPRKRANNTIHQAAEAPVKVEDSKAVKFPAISSQPLAPVHLDELAKIWDTDKRIPTVETRRAWAMARNIKPDLVHRWFARRKQIAKKARQRIPEGTYELRVGTPPIIKDEKTPTPPVLEEPQPSPIKLKAEDIDSALDIRTSDTLVASSPLLPGFKRKLDGMSTTATPLAKPRSPLPPSSPPIPSSPPPSVPFLRLRSPIPSVSDTLHQSQTWCTQGRAQATVSAASFICALCITGSYSVPLAKHARCHR
ncbi:hypothetical protein LshimejAT787_0905790 [Lyophyllum shimeji]|uniref:Homeobox domain-containing protein n=1 Tax=Lyophyllum shimeji TaxID=47721 RepID=A0A9P3UN92_LYOSH|nr:hypothetical protein LshimejAT787_0905790 [Lyophyllum shimeji]